MNDTDKLRERHPATVCDACGGYGLLHERELEHKVRTLRETLRSVRWSIDQHVSDPHAVSSIRSEIDEALEGVGS